MDPNNILESRALKVVVLIITIVGGLIKILGELNNNAVPNIINVALVICALYFGALALQWVGDKFIFSLGKSIAQNSTSDAYNEEIKNSFSRIHKSLDELKNQFSTQNLLPDSIERINDQLVPKIAIAYDAIAERYGIGYSLLDINFDIKRDGAAVVTRTIEIEAFSSIKELDTYLLIPDKSADGSERIINSIELKSLSPPHTITKEKIEKSNHGQLLSVLLNISPPLQSGTTFKFQMQETLPKGLYAFDLPEEELEKRSDPYEYAGWNISRPSKQLTLNVHFPDFYKPNQFDAQVRYVTASIFPSQRIQQGEQQNLQPKMLLDPSGNHYIYNLEVEYPMTGLIYILRWRPIPASSP